MASNGMTEVSKEQFFASFANLEGVSTGCASSSKVWEVRKNFSVIARSVADDDGNEKYFISGGQQ
jgi:hypothetical protein